MVRLAAISLLLATSICAQTGRSFDAPVRDGAMPDWANPAVVRRNVEPTHASVTAYATEEAAHTGRPIAPFYLTAKPTTAPWYQSLNGRWKFHWSPKPADRPTDFFRDDFDDRAWPTIPVPANWERDYHRFGAVGSAFFLVTDARHADLAPELLHDNVRVTA